MEHGATRIVRFSGHFRQAAIYSKASLTIQGKPNVDVHGGPTEFSGHMHLVGSA
jgi:hypothetical protein